jgi:hypothetical protein
VFERLEAGCIADYDVADVVDTDRDNDVANSSEGLGAGSFVTP